MAAPVPPRQAGRSSSRATRRPRCRASSARRRWAGWPCPVARWALPRALGLRRRSAATARAARRRPPRRPAARRALPPRQGPTLERPLAAAQLRGAWWRARGSRRRARCARSASPPGLRPRRKKPWPWTRPLWPRPPSSGKRMRLKARSCPGRGRAEHKSGESQPATCWWRMRSEVPACLHDCPGAGGCPWSHKSSNTEHYSSSARMYEDAHLLTGCSERSLP